MKKNLLILMMVVLALSCSSEGGTIDKRDMKLVTGLNLRITADDWPLQLGNPNVLVNSKFIIYPNPAFESVYLAAVENVTDVWIVRATPKKAYQYIDFSNDLNSNLYSEQTLASHANFSLNGQSSPAISLDISALPKGYYRVFVKIGGQIYWDNLYKGNQPNSEAQMDELIGFWN